MANPAPASGELLVRAEEFLGLNPKFVSDVSVSLRKQERFATRVLLEPLKAPECADLLQLLSPELRHRLVEYLWPDFDPQILPELEETIRNEVADQLGTDSLAYAIATLESDDALGLISTFDEEKQGRILQKIPVELKKIVEEGLSYPEDSAGRLMERVFVAVPIFWTVGKTIDFLREAKDLPNDFYYIFVVDSRHRPIGTISLSYILRSKRPTKFKDIMTSNTTNVLATMDQEEVAFLFSQQNLVSAPVVDSSGRLIGTITVDDVLDVIQEEAEEDIMLLGGVKTDDLYTAAIKTGRSRFSWLFLNLMTAVVASIVIGFFEGTLEQIVILAVLMPIVASMGGNAGTQTMTVAVRALATKELTPSNSMRVLGKEALVGIYNGVCFAILIGVITWFWTTSWQIGLVMGVSMVITLLLAAFAGMSIPLMLDRTGIDPAIASGVILTTITDVAAFSVFLGLAAWFLL